MVFGALFTKSVIVDRVEKCWSQTVQREHPHFFYRYT